MAAQYKLVDKCPKCGKVAKEIYHFLLPNGEMLHNLECGHTVISHAFVAAEEDDKYIVTSKDGKTPYKYQIEGAKFAEESGLRCLIMDEPGLGKTLQGLLAIHLHKEKTLPCLIICKASLVMQIYKELYRFFGYKEGYLVQVIQKGQDVPIEGFDFYIVSYDVLRRISGRSKNKEYSDINWNDDNRKKNPMLNFGFKSVILDEVQAIKNPESARTKEVREICRDVEYIICLSATPAKNHAGELFIPLNILKPKQFRNYKSFLRQHVDQYWRGRSYKLGGLRDPEYFKQITSDFIIRRKRSEVLPDLPAGANRLFREVDFQNKAIEKAYAEAQKEFTEFYYSIGQKGLSKFQQANNILAMLTAMRKLTGIAKVPAVVDFLEEFISGTDRKIVVFLHHEDARNLLDLHLNKLANEYEKDDNKTMADGLRPMFLGADLSQEKRLERLENFRDSVNTRILIASTLAAGEGLNMQFCSDAIMMERQWNPANEEQAEGRFIRIGMTADHVDVHYFIASGTVDEFFTELVEVKRAAMRTLDGQAFTWDENSLLMELAEAVATKGGKKWTINQAIAQANQNLLSSAMEG